MFSSREISTRVRKKKTIAAPKNPAASAINRLSANHMLENRVIRKPVPPNQARNAVNETKLSGETDADRSRLSDRRGLSPQRLRARLSGDLDAIISVAMRKEPDRRYPSVEALADDLSRHLLGQPVRARQGDWRYNTAKFLRRHVWAVAGVAAAFVRLALFGGVTAWENHRIELAREATALEDPLLHAHAAVWLHEHDEEAELRPADRTWLLVDLGVGLLEEADPRDVVAELLPEVPARAQAEIVAGLWQVDHPGVIGLLTALSEHHPDASVARAARKAAFKARSPGSAGSGSRD